MTARISVGQSTGFGYQLPPLERESVLAKLCHSCNLTCPLQEADIVIPYLLESTYAKI